jgi:hypothetical protein
MLSIRMRHEIAMIGAWKFVGRDCGGCWCWEGVLVVVCWR